MAYNNDKYEKQKRQREKMKQIFLKNNYIEENKSRAKIVPHKNKK